MISIQRKGSGGDPLVLEEGTIFYDADVSTIEGLIRRTQRAEADVLSCHEECTVRIKYDSEDSEGLEEEIEMTTDGIVVTVEDRDFMEDLRTTATVVLRPL